MGPAWEAARLLFHVRSVCIVAVALLAGDVPAAQAEMRHSQTEQHGGSRGGSSTLRDIGTGLAIGVIVGGAIKEMSKKSSTPASDSKPASKSKKAGKPSSTRKKQAVPAKPPSPPPAAKPKEEPPMQPAKTSPPPAPLPVPVRAVPESANGAQDEPCEECFDLWNRIRRYQELIAQEQRELAELERTKAQREAEGRDFQARAIRASGQIEGNYNKQMADLADQFVKERGELIDSWKARIAKEQAFLADLLAQFRACVERFCAKLAAMPEPAPEPEPEPAPVSAPPPQEPEAPPPAASAPEKPAPFCPANANAAPVTQKLVHDYGANGPRPPSPTDRIFRLGNIPEEVAWFALFSFYNGGQGRTSVLDLIKNPMTPQPADAMPSGVPTDAVIIEGDVLDTIQQQAEVINQNDWAKFHLRQNADDMFSRLRCGQSGLFTNRGGQVVKGDPAAIRVHLGFGSFSVYWDAVCEIGPKRCCIPDSGCASGWRNETLYNCKVKWTMYDTYNFSHKTGTGGTGPLKRINPLGWGGTPFRSFGYWDDVAGGVLRQCVGQ